MTDSRKLRPAASALAQASFPWWVAGGWALDLYLGRRIRPRKDIDIAVLRRDQLALRGQLLGWDIRVAHDAALSHWPPGVWLSPPLHELWARPSGTRRWLCEFLLNEAANERWVYRRDPRVTYEMPRLLSSEAAGVRILPPEIVLLYKSKDPREEDEIDFGVMLPALTTEAVDWLTRALWVTASARHGWLQRLAEITG